MKRLIDSIKKVKLSGITLGSLVLLGIGIVLYLGLTLFSEAQSTRSGPGSKNPDVCPDCGTPYPKAYRASRQCTVCTLREGKIGELDQSKPSSKRGRATGGSGWLVPTLLISSFVVLLSVHLFVVWRNRAGQMKEEKLFHTACQKCERKLRYREPQAGRIAQCPQCRAVRFPALQRQRWWQIGGLNRLIARKQT